MRVPCRQVPTGAPGTLARDRFRSAPEPSRAGTVRLTLALFPVAAAPAKANCGVG